MRAAPHWYAREDPNRKPVQAWLVIGSVLVLLLISPWVAALPISTEVKVVLAPSALLIYGGLFALFDRLAWRVGYRRLGVSSIPDLNGAWVGVIHSNLGATSSTAKNYQAVITIRQNWSSMQIKLRTGFSTSGSVMAVMTGPRDDVSLRYEYEAGPDDPQVQPPLVREHNGVAAMSLGEDDEGLVFNGAYYTDSRTGQHIGNLHDFHRISLRRLDYVAVTSHPRRSQEMKRLIEKCAARRGLPVERLPV
jgi:hypothetical protein